MPLPRPIWLSVTHPCVKTTLVQTVWLGDQIVLVPFMSDLVVVGKGQKTGVMMVTGQEVANGEKKLQAQRVKGESGTDSGAQKRAPFSAVLNYVVRFLSKKKFYGAEDIGQLRLS